MTLSVERQFQALRAMGSHAFQEGRYAEALEFASRECALGEQHLREQHPAWVAMSLDQLGGLHSMLGNDTAAEDVYQRALAIRRKGLGEEHLDVATSLNKLAMRRLNVGSYEAAEPFLRQALSISRKAAERPRRWLPSLVATSLDNLAALPQSIGKYAVARRLYERALAVRRKLGEEHWDISTSLNNLAELHQKMGNHTAAERLHRQAGAAWRTAGEVSKRRASAATVLAITLNNLALVREATGRYIAAERLLQQALITSRWGSAGARTLDILAHLHLTMGIQQSTRNRYKRHRFGHRLLQFVARRRVRRHYTAAEAFYAQALAIRRETRGENDPEFGSSLSNLGYLRRATGYYTAAEPLLRQALEVCRRSVGPHPSTSMCLNHLAILCAATGREGESLDLAKEATVIDDRMIAQVFSIGSESQRMTYLKTLEKNFSVFLSLGVHLSGSAPAVRTLFELVLRRKAIGAEALAAQRDAVLGGKYPELTPALAELTTLRRQIAQKTLAGPGEEGLSAHRDLLAVWNAKKNRLEADLARQIPEMTLEQRLRAVDRQVIALALPGDAVLIEYVRFDVFDFRAVPGRGERQWKPARYAAFVMSAGRPDDIQMADLGDATAIDGMIATLRISVTGDSEDRRGRGGGGRDDRGGAAIRDEGWTLREAVFDPLQPALGTHTRLLLAPDGDLTRLPFEILPSQDGRRLIDEYKISYLATGRDVLRFGAPSSGGATDSVVAGDPDFDLGLETALAEQPSASRHSRDLSRAKLHFDRLPGTRLEAERIAALVAAQPWLEDRVLEARIKACRSPLILHLATHGFFLPNQQLDASKAHDAEATQWLLGDGAIRLAGVGLENPLLRSGLALAGVNTWLQKHKTLVEAEDGCLTAEDVSGLDLLATELVVLSACETGLGEVRTGEGVFGLRRAFVLAGTKTLVMSLWKVPDAQTQELMEDFYGRLLAGQGRADALRDAQLALKVRTSDPFSWGAFICQGNPGPFPATGPSRR